MNRDTGTGKYEQLLERCASLEPIPTAVAHPCEATALAGAIEAGEQGLITPILVGPAAKIDEIAEAERHRPRQARDRRRAAQPCVSGQGGGAGPPGQGRAADEGQPAHRRTAGRGRRARDGPAHRPAHQPRLHHGRADVSQGADRHRRGDQHRADAGGQGRHLPERDRPGDLARRRTSRRSRSSPRSRRSPRRCPRRSTPPRSARWPSAGRSRAACSTARWRSTTRSARRPREIKGITLRGRRRSRHPARAGPRGRQHPGEAAQLPGQRRQRRPGARRARADHPDQPRRQRAVAHRQLRGRDARGACAAAATAAVDGS